MKVFKGIIGFVNTTITTFGFILGTEMLFNGYYELASWLLFGVSILFIVGYFTERWNK